jgi:hypothetical protein
MSLSGHAADSKVAPIAKASTRMARGRVARERRTCAISGLQKNSRQRERWRLFG